MGSKIKWSSTSAKEAFLSSGSFISCLISPEHLWKTSIHFIKLRSWMLARDNFIIISYSNSKWHSEWHWLNESTIRENASLQYVEVSEHKIDF